MLKVYKSFDEDADENETHSKGADDQNKANRR